MTRSLALAIALLSLLTGCGPEERTEPSAPSSKPSSSVTGTVIARNATMRPCSAVWVVGETLPKHYPGCVEDDGVTVIENSETICTDVGEVLRHLEAESYHGRLVATLGGTITEDRVQAQTLAAELKDCASEQRE